MNATCSQDGRDQYPYDSLDGGSAISEHASYLHQVEDYVKGRTSVQPEFFDGCHSSCSIGRWLHSEDGVRCKSVELIKDLEQSCQQFYTSANQAILLAAQGHTQQAQSNLNVMSDASAKFQSSVAALQVHIS